MQGKLVVGLQIYNFDKIVLHTYNLILKIIFPHYMIKSPEVYWGNH